MEGNLKTAIFYFLYVIALLPVFFFRDFTPDNELRYLSIADEALRDNTFFAFTNHGVPYADKPPLFLWCVMGLRSLAGTHYLWIYSLLTILPAIGIARIFDRWAQKVIPADSRLLSQAMLLSTGLFLAATLVMRMDMLMCLFIVLALYEFWKITENPSCKSSKWLFPVYVFLAVFTKGPLGILIPVVSIIVYSCVLRKFRFMSLCLGWRCWAVLLPLCVLWFLGVYLEGGVSYLNNLLFHQTVDRAVNSFHHAKSVSYYFISIWYCLVPWSLAILGIVIAGIRKVRLTESLQTFFVTVSLSSMVLLTCISSKLQIYMLPAVPFMIYAFAISLPRYQKNLLVKIGLSVISAIFVLVLPALFVVPQIKSGILPDSPWIWVIAGCLCVSGLSALVSLYAAKKAMPVNSAAFSLTWGILSTLFFAGFIMPQYNDYIGYRNLADKINEISVSSGITTVVCGDVRRAENIDVYLNDNIKIIDEPSATVGDEVTSRPHILVTDAHESTAPAGLQSEIVGRYSITPIK